MVVSRHSLCHGLNSDINIRKAIEGFSILLTDVKSHLRYYHCFFYVLTLVFCLFRRGVIGLCSDFVIIVINTGTQLRPTVTVTSSRNTKQQQTTHNVTTGTNSTNTMAITKLVSSPTLASKTKCQPSSKRSSFSIRSTKASSTANVVKQVCFNESQNVLYANTQWTRNEARRAWFSNTEFDAMKRETIALTKQVYRAEQEIIDQEHESYTNVLVYVYDLCRQAEKEKQCKLPNDARKLLKNTVRKWANRTGLEKLCICDIAMDKRQRRKELAETVLDTQEKNMDKSPMERAKLIRAASLVVTRPSRFFARFMASASKVGEQ